MRKHKTTIGHIVRPGCAGMSLEHAVRLYLHLLPRSLLPTWRFKGRWNTTGPLETMLGYANCGDGTRGMLKCSMSLRDGAPTISERIAENLLRAICDYVGFASLDEEIPDWPYESCGEAVKSLAGFVNRKTNQPLNASHPRARTIRDVQLILSDSGVSWDSYLSYARDHGSSWRIFGILRQPNEYWSGRGRLATWLEKAMGVMGDLCDWRAA